MVDAEVRLPHAQSLAGQRLGFVVPLLTAQGFGQVPHR